MLAAIPVEISPGRMPPQRANLSHLFGCDYRAMWANERNDATFGEARVSCPANTIGTCIVKAAPGLDQHVQAHQKSGQMGSPRVIDQKFIDDQRAPFFERGMGLADQH